MAVRACRVSCQDPADVEHSVEVTASSLFEAVPQALRIFRENEWVNEIGHGRTLFKVRPLYFPQWALPHRRITYLFTFHCLNNRVFFAFNGISARHPVQYAFVLPSFSRAFIFEFG